VAKTRLELTWIRKENRSRLEPRGGAKGDILLFDGDVRGSIARRCVGLALRL